MGARASCKQPCRDATSDAEPSEVQQLTNHTSPLHRSSRKGGGVVGFAGVGDERDPLADEFIAAAPDGSFRSVSQLSATQKAPSMAEFPEDSLRQIADESGEEEEEEEDAVDQRNRPKLMRATVFAARAHEAKVLTSMCCQAIGCRR
mmetsp:Transcript_112538/g.325165  ORF Transcript_112538/g.325165 Transcript_112538/m.325165 type:complete len:147 (+) Transcript_112538:68-508(+)